MFSLSGRSSRNPASSSQSLGEMNYSGVGLIQNLFFPLGMRLILVQQLGLVHIGKRNLFSIDGSLDNQKATQTNEEMKFHLIL